MTGQEFGQQAAYPSERLIDVGSQRKHQWTDGLTKLEVFTMAAMQGLMSSNNRIYSEVPIDAIYVAKATLDALAKEMSKTDQS